MSPSSLKRINKEIKNFNEKMYCSHIFSHNLLAFLGNLNLTIISVNTNNNTNKDEYFVLIKNRKNKKLLELKFPEYYPFKPYSVISYDSNVNNDLLNNEISYYKYLINVANKIQTRNKNIYKYFFKNIYSLKTYYLDISKND